MSFVQHLGDVCWSIPARRSCSCRHREGRPSAEGGQTEHNRAKALPSNRGSSEGDKFRRRIDGEKCAQSPAQCTAHSTTRRNSTTRPCDPTGSVPAPSGRAQRTLSASCPPAPSGALSGCDTRAAHQRECEGFVPCARPDVHPLDRRRPVVPCGPGVGAWRRASVRPDATACRLPEGLRVRSGKEGWSGGNATGHWASNAPDSCQPRQATTG